MNRRIEDVSKFQHPNNGIIDQTRLEQSMKIFRLADLTIEPNAEERLRDADTELSALRALGEFSAEVQQEIYRSFLPDRINDTLNMEGIRVNPRVTKAIMEGLSLAESDRYTMIEISNIISANELIEADAPLRLSLTPGTIKEIQRRVVKDLSSDAGSYRKIDVQITGAKRQPPAWSDVQDLVAETCQLLNESREIHPIVKAAWLHATIAAIHPFSDGNGRTSRLLQDFLLIESGYLPVGIPVARRDRYYQSLEKADDGNFNELIEIIVGSELLALDKVRRHAEAPRVRMEGVRRMLAVANNKTEQADHKRYELWRRQVIGIRDEIVRWTDELNKNSANLFLETYTYDPIGFDVWRDIRSGSFSRNTWLLSLKLYLNQSPVYSVLFYVRKHNDNFVDSTHQVHAGSVGVFITGCDEGERFTFSGFRDPYISLREILFDGTQLLVYTFAGTSNRPKVSADEPDEYPVGQKWKLDASSSLTEVLERFFVDLLTKLGLN